MKTQVEVNAKIDHYIRLACNAEAIREAQVFESKEYWKYHDLAMKWHEKARKLMPKGS